MLNDIDTELFPDLCEVAELSTHEHCYLIKKNGSTSLRSQVRIYGQRILCNEQIRNLEQITIIVREPQARYISGLQTFAEQLCRENKDLDFVTCVWMGDRFRFLNRHYLPQFLWLCNLKKFIDPKCRLLFRGMDHLARFTRYHYNPSSTVNKVAISPNPAMDLWFFIDQLLVESIGQDYTWQELLDIYRDHPASPLDELVARLEKMSDVLS